MAAFLSSVPPLAWALPYGVIIIGNSIAVGYTAGGPVTPYGSLVPVCTSRLNVAVSGYRLDQILAGQVPQIAPFARESIVVVEGAFNDLLQGDAGGVNPQPEGVDAAGAMVRMVALVAAVRALSPRAIIGLTCLSVAPATTYYTPYLVAQVAAFNALLRASGLFDAICDVGAVSGTVTRSDDGLHPDQAGHVTIAALLAPYVTAALP